MDASPHHFILVSMQNHRGHRWKCAHGRRRRHRRMAAPSCRGCILSMDSMQPFTKLNHFLCVCDSVVVNDCCSAAAQVYWALGVCVRVCVCFVLLDASPSTSHFGFSRCLSSHRVARTFTIQLTVSQSTILFIRQTFSFVAAAAATPSFSNQK